MELSQAAHRPMGSFRAPRPIAGVRDFRVSRHLVVGRGARRQAWKSPVINPSAGWQAAPSLTRRSALIAGVALVAAAHGRICTATAAETETHGLSAFGDLKYPADFTHFDYVDPHAPKDGAFSQIGPNRRYNQSFLTFNSLNSYMLRNLPPCRRSCECRSRKCAGPRRSDRTPGHRHVRIHRCQR